MRIETMRTRQWSRQEYVLEVYRLPIRRPAGRREPRYATARRRGPAAVVSPLAVPSARIRVRDLLP